MITALLQQQAPYTLNEVGRMIVRLLGTSEKHQYSSDARYKHVKAEGGAEAQQGGAAEERPQTNEELLCCMAHASPTHDELN